MTEALPPRVELRPYAAGDLALLTALLGDPEMTAHLGGPESPEALRARHERYLASDPETNGLFVILAGAERVPAGWVGYWETPWRDATAWEFGWHLLAEQQGRGVATIAMTELLSRARRTRRHRMAVAFPAIENVASNALAARLSFGLLGETEVEFPKGRWMRANEWALELWPDADAPDA